MRCASEIDTKKYAWSKVIIQKSIHPQPETAMHQVREVFVTALLF